MEETLDAVISAVIPVANGWNIELAPGGTWLAIYKTQNLPKPEVGDIVTVRVPRVLSINKPNE